MHFFVLSVNGQSRQETTFEKSKSFYNWSMCKSSKTDIQIYMAVCSAFVQPCAVFSNVRHYNVWLITKFSIHQNI